MVSYGEKLKSEKNFWAKVHKCIISSSSIFLWGFVIPMMVFLLIFLGALQAIYPHESSFQEDLNISMGTMGMAFYSIYDIGVKNPKWFYYFLFIFVGYVYFVGAEIWDNIRRVWRDVDDMTAQEIIDISNIETDMKGGKRYKNDSINNR